MSNCSLCILFLRNSGDGQTDELEAHQRETGGNHDNIGGIGLPAKGRGCAPAVHHDKNGCKRGELTDLDTHIEGKEVRQEPIG